MKTIYTLFTCILLSLVTINAQAQYDYVEYSGVVKSKSDNKAVPTCSISIKGQDLGTAANYDGEFAIKVPTDYTSGTLVFSSIGYQTEEIPMAQLKESGNEIILKINSYMLENIEIRGAEAILAAALKVKEKNYSNEAQGLTVFYREIVTKNKKYVDVSQGVLDIYKAPYNKKEKSMVNIHKGFRSKQYKKDDTLAFKIQSGMNTILQLDLVKNPGEILSLNMMRYYDYAVTDIVDINGKRTFEISFTPKRVNEMTKFHGFIYVDQNSVAITAVKFSYSDVALQIFGRDLVKKKPTFAKLTPLDIRYEVAYKESNGFWYLSYVKNDITMKCNWKKKLFNKTFTATSEMVTTERLESVNKDDFKSYDNQLVFSEEAGKYNDPKFWEGYSIIKPEDDVQKALVKIIN
ncbi:MAG: DUF5686 and carboxypeptidase regulatory-like domain-containing protein [Reichenbachiella sp.]